MANTKVYLGKDAGLYRNTGSYGSPTWSEVANVKDLTISGDKEKTDVANRTTGGFGAEVATMKNLGLEFSMNHDSGDTDWTALQAAWLNDTAIEYLVLDQKIAVVGAQGWRFTGVVNKFTDKQPLKGAQETDVGIGPTISAHAPALYTVAS